MLFQNSLLQDLFNFPFTNYFWRQDTELDDTRSDTAYHFVPKYFLTVALLYLQNICPPKKFRCLKLIEMLWEPYCKLKHIYDVLEELKLEKLIFAVYNN